MQPHDRIKNMIKRMKSHLDSVQLSYIQHLFRALRFSLFLSVAALMCFIHALFPFLFETSASRIIIKLHREM